MNSVVATFSLQAKPKEIVLSSEEGCDRSLRVALRSWIRINNRIDRNQQTWVLFTNGSSHRSKMPNALRLIVSTELEVKNGIARSQSHALEINNPGSIPSQALVSHDIAPPCIFIIQAAGLIEKLAWLSGTEMRRCHEPRTTRNQISNAPLYLWEQRVRKGRKGGLGNWKLNQSLIPDFTANLQTTQNSWRGRRFKRKPTALFQFHLVFL